MALRKTGDAQGRSGSKRRRICNLNPSAVEEEGLDATLEPSTRCDVVLENSSWGMISEDLLDLIFASLPFAAQGRFRCVCRRWKDLVCLPPPSMIMSRSPHCNATIYCDSEKKWFRLPSNSKLSLLRNFEVVDVEAGLVCYQCNINGRFWLCLRNPLESSLAEIIAPNYPRWDPQLRTPLPPQVKLLVDRANKTYRVLALLDRQYSTAVYEPTLSVWRVFKSSPRYFSLELFVWENVVDAYNTKPPGPDTLVAAFDMESGKWVKIEVKVPSEARYPKNKVFLSSQNQVTLVLSWHQNRLPYFSVWKLDRDSLDGPFSKWEKWESLH